MDDCIDAADNNPKVKEVCPGVLLRLVNKYVSRSEGNDRGSEQVAAVTSQECADAICKIDN